MWVRNTIKKLSKEQQISELEKTKNKKQASFWSFSNNNKEKLELTNDEIKEIEEGIEKILTDKSLIHINPQSRPGTASFISVSFTLQGGSLSLCKESLNKVEGISFCYEQLIVLYDRCLSGSSNINLKLDTIELLIDDLEKKIDSNNQDTGLFLS